MTLVIIMRFRVASGRDEEWERFVEERCNATAKMAGFERMYLLRPGSSEHEYRVVSWWEELENPEAWIRKEAYAYAESQDHEGIVVGPVEHEILQIVKEF